MTPVDSHIESEINTQRNWLLPLVALLCFVVISLTYFTTKHSEDERFQYNFEKATSAYTVLLQSNISAYENYLDDLSRFFQASQNVDRDEFHSFTDGEFTKFPAIKGIYWVPFVANKNRLAYEQKFLSDPKSALWIHERSHPDSDMSVKARERDYYYPITFAQPLSSNQESVGFDMGSDPKKRAIFDTVRRTGKAVVLTSQGNANGIYHEGAPSSRSTIIVQPVVKERGNGRAFMGLLLLQFDLGETLEKAISNVMSSGIDIRLVETDGTQSRTLYFHNSRLGGKSVLSDEVDFNTAEGTKYKSRLQVHDKEIIAQYAPVESYIELHYLWQGELILAIGIIATLLLLRVMFTTTRKNEDIKNLVRRRTSELQASLNRQQAILGSMADSVIVIDGQSKILSFNTAAERTFGYNEDEVIGRDVSILLPEDERDQHKVYTTNAEMHAPRIIRRTRQLMGWHKSGRNFPIELNITPIELTAGRGFVGIIKDISERKLAEEQALQSQKMTALGRLAGGVAHEFNNLLTIISGYARMAQKNIDDTERALSSLNEITQAADQAAGLTKQMLSFGRRQEISHSDLDVANTVRELISMLRPLLPESVHLDIKNECENIFISGDRHQLTQAIMNLSLNACDAMKNGGVLSISVDAIQASDPKDRAAYASNRLVEIKVKDTGSGMDETVRKRIFEPFFTTKDIGKGTGLGLAMVHGAITSMDGSISVSSQEGVGTEFIIHLPMIDHHSKPATAQKANTSSPSRSGGALTILVVEDQKAVRLLAKDALEDAGHSVDEAENGQDALDMIKTRGAPYPVIVSDVAMPKMDGIEMAKTIIKTHPDVFFIFISGHSQFADITTKIPGINGDFIQKPFDPDMLVDIVQEHIDQNR